MRTRFRDAAAATLIPAFAMAIPALAEDAPAVAGIAMCTFS
jgi:hypothetical protein